MGKRNILVGGTNRDFPDLTLLVVSPLPPQPVPHFIKQWKLPNRKTFLLRYFLLSSCIAIGVCTSLSQSFTELPKRLSILGVDTTRVFNLNRHVKTPPTSITAGDSDLHLASEWLWGECNTVDLYRDSIAIIGNGHYIHTIDLSHLDSPKIVGEYLHSATIRDLTVRDTLLYAVGGDKLIILDVSDPLSPSVVSEATVTATSCKGIVLENTLAFITTYYALVVVDVGNPLQPMVLDNIPLGERFGSHNVKDGIVFVGNNYGAITLYPDIIDARDPLNLSWLGSLSSAGPASALTVVETTLYVAGKFHPGIGYYLQAFSVSNPMNPRSLWIDTLTIGTGMPVYLTVRDSFAFVSGYPDFQVYSLNDTTGIHPLTAISRAEAQFPNIKIALRDSMIVGAQGTGLWTMKSFLPDSLQSISYFMTGYATAGVSVSRNTGYLTHYSAGITVLDLNDFSHPRRVQGIEIPIRGDYYSWNDAYEAATWDRHLYVTTTNGLEVFSIEDSTLPVPVDHVPMNLSKYIVVQNDLAFVSENFNSLAIFSLAHPGHPDRIGSYLLPPGGTINSISVYDSVVILSMYSGGISILSVSDPTKPTLVSTIPGFSACAINIDSLLYKVTSTDSSDFTVYSIKDPFQPLILGSIDLNLFGISQFAIAADSDFVYFDTYSMDVSQPNRPNISARFTSRESISDILGWNRYILFCDYESLTIIENDAITDVNEEGLISRIFKLRQNFPNPFNASTRIEYSLRESQYVTLQIFNLQGVLIDVLINEHQAPGNYQVDWQPVRLPSGVYYYYLNAGSESDVRTMLFLK